MSQSMPRHATIGQRGEHSHTAHLFTNKISKSTSVLLVIGSYDIFSFITRELDITILKSMLHELQAVDITLFD